MSIPKIEIPLDAKCQENAPLPVNMYIPCGAPAVALIWHEHDHRSYWMCEACAYHNVVNRGGKLVAGSIESALSAPYTVDPNSEGDRS